MNFTHKNIPTKSRALAAWRAFRAHVRVVVGKRPLVPLVSQHVTIHRCASRSLVFCSPKAPFIGAIDQGTSSTRFMIFDSTGQVVVNQQEEFEQIYPVPG